MAHAISNVFAPRVNILVAKDSPMDQISELMIRIGRLQYLVVSLVLSGYIVFGRVFIQLWAGPDYQQAYYVALLTMIPLAVPLIQNIAFTTIVAQNKHRFRSIVYAVIAMVNVVSTWLVLPYYGIIGAAACTAVAFVVGQGVIMNIYYYKVTGLDIPAFWKNIGKMSLIPAVMIIVWGPLIRYVLPMSSLWWFMGWVVVYTGSFAGLSWLISMNSYEKALVTGLLEKIIIMNRR
jgi:O-antigen/teichoic acid export membrane protein